jgi:hypothetical protein
LNLLLDLRCFLNEVDPKLAGPAFVLSDNGKGLYDREWASLSNLHDSKKKFSPQEIGQYGMGSRSYFHYADVILVCSNGVYKGIDPRRCVTTHGRKKTGWKLPNCQQPSGNKSEIAMASDNNVVQVSNEANTLFFENFPEELRPNSGACFRLPLRLSGDSDTHDSAESDSSLGAAMSVEDADMLLTKWAHSLQDGKLLLFLANVEEVSIWRWAPDALQPTLLQSLHKEYQEGSGFDRLPSSLPSQVCKTYTALNAYLATQSSPELQALSSRQTAVVRMTTGGRCEEGDEGCVACESTWLVSQRFDVDTPAVLEFLAAGCLSVPIVSVAIPLLQASVVAGAPFCSLPIGSIQTNLPVHLNASFAVHKNRRSLWSEAVSVPTIAKGDQHALWSRWNNLLLNSLLPRI